jgi:8-oxo-dGTP diphosphatase
MVVPVAAAIILNEEGQVLLARRLEEDPQGPRWEFPGGKLRKGESPQECLKRELQEELGIEAEVRDFFHAVEQELGDRSILLLTYFCRWNRGEIELRAHSAWKWMDPGDLMELDLLEADRIVAAMLLSQWKSAGVQPG